MYTLIHCLVDLTCIYRLYVRVLPGSGPYDRWLLMVILYNFLAFALPGLIGLLADLLDCSDSMAALGCVLTALPSFVLPGAILPAVVLQGIGNGLFHVGAGRRVLKESGGKYAPSGIFISSGAMGVFLGTIWRHAYCSLLLQGLAAALLLCAVLLLFWGRRKKAEQKAVGKSSEAEGECYLTPPVLMILFVVAIRSFYGTAVQYEWKNTLFISLVFACCIVLGKALGGILADHVGVCAAAAVSLLGAAVTVLFSVHSPLLGCLSILLFNMTMPITLTLLASCWKKYPGFAFGILMLALFIGTLPELLGIWRSLPVLQLCLVSVLSCALLLGAICFSERFSRPLSQ